MKHLLVAVIYCYVVIFSVTAAQGAGHYPAGVEGYKAPSLPSEGFHWKIYNIAYTAKRFNNNSGNKTGRGNIDTFTHMHRFILPVTHIDAIGADWVVDIAVPFTWGRINNTGWRSNDHGVGDILIEPLLLSWHGTWYDALVGVSIFAPTGEYDKDKFSPGSNYWSFLLDAGTTVYFDEAKTWSASLLARYEINTRNDKTDIRDGDSIIAEWSAGKNFLGMFDLAVAGAHKIQVTDSSGRVNNSWRDEMHAIGPEVGFTYAPWKLYISLRSLWEYRTANGPQGNMTTLSIVKSF